MAAPLKICRLLLRGCPIVKEIIPKSTCFRNPLGNTVNRIPAFIQVRSVNLVKKRKEKQPHIAKDKQWKKTTKKKVGSAAVQKKKVTEEFLQRVPTDDVWIRDMYPEQSYLLDQTITMHKEFADPTMLNNMKGLIYADMTLVMRLQKKTKALADISGNIIMPHVFADNKEKKILALSKDDDVIRTALKMGAIFAGGQDCIKEIKDGDIPRDAFDHVVCTPCIVTELLPIRSILRERFPSKLKHNIGSDMVKLMNTFLNGVSYKSVKLVENKFVGVTSVPFGIMEMPTQQLTENFYKMIDTICSHSVIKGPFITKITVRAPPSSEIFTLKHEKYVPGYDESDDEDEHRPEAVASF